MGTQLSMFSDEVVNGPVGPAALAKVREQALRCCSCPLSLTRRNVVFGRGSEEPVVAFVGEAPGEAEDRTGRPFVGKSGRLLVQMIEAVGYSPETVFVTNSVLCRPPENRDPSRAELLSCKPFLFQQLRCLQPSAIVMLGKVAGNALLGNASSISQLRGRWYLWEGIPARATFHPAFLLREPGAKRAAWDDLQAISLKLKEAA